MEKVKRCGTCKLKKSHKDFFNNKATPDNYSWSCKQCTANFNRVTRIGRYGLTKIQFNALLEEQDFRCGICQRVFDSQNQPSIDHDYTCCPSSPKNIEYKSGRGHQTKACGRCVRGLLCKACNTGLGMFMDNTEYLVAAIRYLTKSLPETYPLEEISLETLNLIYEFEGEVHG